MTFYSKDKIWTGQGKKDLCEQNEIYILSDSVPLNILIVESGANC